MQMYVWGLFFLACCVHAICMAACYDVSSKASRISDVGSDGTQLYCFQASLLNSKDVTWKLLKLHAREGLMYAVSMFI